jgi:hypothetical protein
MSCRLKAFVLAVFAGLQLFASQELADYLRSDLAKWGKVVKDAGIKPE